MSSRAARNSMGQRDVAEEMEPPHMLPGQTGKQPRAGSIISWLSGILQERSQIPRGLKLNLGAGVQLSGERGCHGQQGPPGSRFRGQAPGGSHGLSSPSAPLHTRRRVLAPGPRTSCPLLCHLISCPGPGGADTGHQVRPGLWVAFSDPWVGERRACPPNPSADPSWVRLLRKKMAP